jgi:hypothetical protein
MVGCGRQPVTVLGADNSGSAESGPPGLLEAQRFGCGGSVDPMLERDGSVSGCRSTGGRVG